MCHMEHTPAYAQRGLWVCTNRFPDVERVSLPTPPRLKTPFEQLCINTCSQRQTARREITHRQEHVFQPTTAWTHCCTAGFLCIDVFPQSVSLEAYSKEALPC